MPEERVNHSRAGMASEELGVTGHIISTVRETWMLELRSLSSFLQPAALALGKTSTKFIVVKDPRMGSPSL